MSHPSSRMVTAVDHQRLFALMDRLSGPDLRPLAALAEFLDHAEVIPSQHITHDVVTMRSQVHLRATPDHTPLDVTLSYPGEAQPNALSILTPLGASLIGSRLGDEICWQGADGRERRAVLAAMRFQPEAAGLYHL